MKDICLPPLEPPLDALTRLGKPTQENADTDYRALGLNESHVPALIELARCWLPIAAATHENDLPEGDALWAPLHAWQALGQLQALEAVPALLDLMHDLEQTEDDWFLEFLPKALARMGPDVREPLSAFLGDPGHGLYSRSGAAHALTHLAQAHPEVRGEVIASIADQLGDHGQDTGELNGYLVGHLLDIEAVEAAEAIERAYADNAVDPYVAGHWPRVRERLGVPGLGLVPEPEPEPEPELPLEPAPQDSVVVPSSPHSPQEQARRKAKRKQQVQSRKQNRKKGKKRKR